MQLGLLDFCTMRKGQSPAERVFESVQLAQRAEELGFSRFWLAEHHEMGYAHHVPDVLAALIAGSTSRIRVGVAGMLLRLHSPMRVAKTFRLLETFFSGRLDLGIAGGFAAPAMVAALRGEPLPAQDDYYERVRDLVEMVRGESPLKLNPLDVVAPPLWLLSTGGARTTLEAARHGTSLGLSLCHTASRDDSSPLLRYRDEFRPNAYQERPQWNVAVACQCAETEEEARRLAASSPSNPHSGLEIVGTPEQCRERFEALAHRYQTDELIVLDISPGHDSSMRSMRLLSEQFHLSP